MAAMSRDIPAITELQKLSEISAAAPQLSLDSQRSHSHPDRRAGVASTTENIPYIFLDYETRFNPRVQPYFYVNSPN